VTEGAAGASGERRRLGVLGWPVAHSRSPQMFAAALSACGLAGWRYQRLPIPPELFVETVRALPVAGFAGANVTIPHKRAALGLADTASPGARAIGAANTLTFRGEQIEASNTDAPGLLGALPASPAGRDALVLGAGGSARAVVWALLGAGAGDVLVHARTPERARELCAELGGTPVAEPVPAALVVNCTPVGLADPSESPLAAAAVADYACVVDLVYGARETALVAAARRAGSTVVDGIDVLVSQGALAFEHWFAQPAPRQAMAVAARAGRDAPGIARESR
jgi:shikimate dehydrogenase